MTLERMNMESAPLKSSLLIRPVSADCNLRCDYCFYLEKAALYPQTKTHRMSQKVLETLISQVMQHTAGPVSLAWQGGEPTLAGLDFFMQVVELEMQYARPGQIVGNALQTNGILLNEAWAEFLRLYKFLIGLSLDGPSALHDHYRRTKNQRASFGLVYPQIELLRQNMTSLSMTSLSMFWW
ncbi:radical SAM protein [candidate division KSB1 bacterium]|nr:radical SAM protein [candidate division KSB1 bacterium]